MTKLSDLLRGAAERAPMDGISVSAARARQRVRVNRGMRGVANGIAGAGAAALIVVGVMQPNLASANAFHNEDLLAPNAAQPTSEQADNLAAGNRDMMPIYDSGWGTCGSYPLNSYPSGPGTAITLSIASDGWTDLNGGDGLYVPINRLATNDSTAQTTGPDVAILYNGMLVGFLPSAEAEQVLSLVTGDSTDSTVKVPLVNCFDGAALPAANYELVVSQGFTDVVDEPTPEPTLAPDPGLSPEPVPMPSLTTVPVPVEPNGGIGSADASVSSVVAPPQPDPSTTTYRVTSSPVTFNVAGDLVDDPFGQYINTWVQPVLPEGVLTPAQAREMYAQSVSSNPWNMAAGTSRWIIPNYDATPVGAETFAATRNSWYGCSYDGVTGLRFPAQSATLDLLQVTATIPSRIHVSYGWVVDGNPKVTYSLTNSSDYLLPGFYGEPNRQLYLVKDGVVVAQAYPVNTNPNQSVAYMVGSKESAVSPAVSPDVGQYYGLLSQGASLAGDYLWRDVTGCSVGSSQSMVTAGTYTVLSEQSLYLQSGDPNVVPMYSDAAVESKPVARDESSSNGVVEPGTATVADPNQPTYDWLELQMWTSLGTVTITTN